MAFQFNVRTLLFVVACACMWLAGARIATAVSAILDRGQQTSALVLFCSSMLLAPYWMPTLVLAYALGTGKFTRLTFYAGIGTWRANSDSRTLSGIDDVIPGDWGYIFNDANTTNPTRVQDPNWAPGLEGENVIYVGANRFWGNFAPGVNANTWQQWFADIRAWTGTDGAHGKPRMDRDVEFSTLGLE